MRAIRFFTYIFYVLACSKSDAADANRAAFDWPPADPAAVARWADMRFGMFIHWGPVSITGREIGWSRGGATPVEVYDALYKQFNPAKFNADEWVGVAKAAGMKYLVLTAKHHDGFCLWDTKLTGYNVMNTPFKRDVVKELAAACKKQDIAFGTYYSTCDWYNTNWPFTSPGGKTKRESSDLDAYEQYLQAQITELISNYGPLLTIWNDVPGVYGKRGADTIKLVRQLQPDILVNDRTGDGGDYDTPEQRAGKFQNNRPWETCMTICRQWAWKPDDEMKSLKACLHTLVTCAGGDGNLLLNVGPTAEGVIEARQVERLREMGEWLKRNGESIYGTRGGPWKPTKAIASTRRGTTVYLHILRPPDGAVVLPDLPVKIKSARLISGGDKLDVQQKDGKLTIVVPAARLDDIDTIVCLELKTLALDLPVLTLESDIKGTASSVYQNQTDPFGPQQAFDNDPDTCWKTDAGTKQAWIAADLGKPLTIKRVRIEEKKGESAIRKFEFQYRDGETWKTIFTGESIGRWFQQSFEPVTAREFRLNILESVDDPSIKDMEFFEN